MSESIGPRSRVNRRAFLATAVPAIASTALLASAAPYDAAALHCALTGLGVGPGDEVILPAWTWHSCYTTIVMTGALPVFAEVDESLTIDPDDVEAKITPQTKAIMTVHLFGAPADMGRIM